MRASTLSRPDLVPFLGKKLLGQRGSFSHQGAFVYILYRIRVNIYIQ